MSPAPTPREIIAIHLSPHPTPLSNGLIYHSCLTAALTDARKVTGRALKTGIVNWKLMMEGGDPGSWLGAIGYMAIIEQIGTCYFPKSATRSLPDPNTNAFKRALYYFTNLPREHINALYSLRCSFVHNYTLLNRESDRGGKWINTYVFLLSGDEISPLIEHPPHPGWDGNLNGLTKSSHETKINLRKLGDTAESIFILLCEMFSKDELEIALIDREDELLRRFGFTTTIGERLIPPSSDQSPSGS